MIPIKIYFVAKDVFKEAKSRGITYVFISVKFEVPPELEREVFVTSIDLPNREELSELVRNMAQQNNVQIENKDSTNNEWSYKLIIGDSYTFLKEDESSFLRDGSEFSTAMNACGRNHEEKVAMEVLKGDRFLYLDELEHIAKNHRVNLAKGIENCSKIAPTEFSTCKDYLVRHDLIMF